jgi:hypothetical protein
MRSLLVIAALGVGALIGSQFITVLVVQPIGAIPDGVTAIVTRGGGMNFIDSPDAWCERNSNGVSLLCRAAMLAGVTKHKTILLRLPYSHTLYRLSTGGREYDR